MAIDSFIAPTQCPLLQRHDANILELGVVTREVSREKTDLRRGPQRVNPRSALDPIDVIRAAIRRVVLLAVDVSLDDA